MPTREPPGHAGTCTTVLSTGLDRRWGFTRVAGNLRFVLGRSRSTESCSTCRATDDAGRQLRGSRDPLQDFRPERHEEARSSDESGLDSRLHGFRQCPPSRPDGPTSRSRGGRDRSVEDRSRLPRGHLLTQLTSRARPDLLGETGEGSLRPLDSAAPYAVRSLLCGGPGPHYSRSSCCDRGSGHADGRPRGSDPATYCSSTSRVLAPADARHHGRLHGSTELAEVGLATDLRE